MTSLRELQFFVYLSKKYLLINVILYYIFCGQIGLVYSEHNINNKHSASHVVKSSDELPGYSLRTIADGLSEKLAKISNEELGLAVIEKMYKSFSYTSAVPNAEKSLRKLASKLSNKLSETFAVLDRTREIFENYHEIDDKSTLTSAIHPCLYAPFNALNNKYIVNKQYANLSSSYIEDTFDFSEVFEKENSKLKNLKSAIKQQYYLSTMDTHNNDLIAISRCDMHDDSNLWKNYMSWYDTLPRRILLMLDHGGSLSSQQISIVKAVAKQMISVLSPNDVVGILALSDDISSPFFTENCSTPNQLPVFSKVCSFAPATLHNKDIMYRFIDTLVKGSGSTNHSLGFQLAFEALRNAPRTKDYQTMLLYISRGLLSSLMEVKTVLETISLGIESLYFNVVINTCAVIDDTKPIMYEIHFLKDIVKLNFTKYKINTTEINNTGIMLSVNSSKGIGLATARFYKTLQGSSLKNAKHQLSLPIWDSVSKDLTVMATIPCGEDGELGILGVDIFFSNLMEDVTYFSNHLNYTYAFVMDLNGTVIMHPSYPRPISVQEQLQFVDIAHLEKMKNFKQVRKQLLSQKQGQYKLDLGNGKNRLKYYWERVQDCYIICIVVRDDLPAPNRPHKVSWYPSASNHELVHHRLDLLPSSTMCLHLKQLSTIDAGSLFLSASCFQSPFAYVSGSSGYSVTHLEVQSYMAYLKDTTRLLANPGLKEEVRDDVAALASVLDALASKHLHGSRTRYVVRRYLTSPNGVMEMFPGGVVPATLEPTRRSWFVRATEHRGKTILTPPYLDAGGAGYIVTVAYSTGYVVTAMDVTYGYVYKQILQAMPFCSDKNITCFMMDDRGYLIYHPNLIDPNGRGPIEQQHIIHKESLVANDILNHNHFIKKKLCNNYADGTIQRYYSLNTSITDTLTNVVHGEHCVKYRVAAVPATNVFVGVVNTTCVVFATFCPCSMVDRLCLNCNRMEQTECECPCECPLNLGTCSHPNVSLTENELCPNVPEQAHVTPNNMLLNFLFKLKPCMSPMCDMYHTYESCLGVVGCEWCQLHADGETPLQNPFCTPIRTCFNGVLGSEELVNSTYSPVGPVAGSLLGLFTVLALIFYCYRHYAGDRVERVYLSSVQDGQGMRMSNLDLRDDFHEDNLDNHQDKLLHVAKKPEPVSPYCVSTGYRRPTPAADSDHGYSTMTPHEESEHLSFTLIELESLEDDYVASDVASTNTSTSIARQPHKHPPMDKQQQQMLTPVTQVPFKKNCILAPVTVHRHMETM